MMFEQLIYIDHQTVKDFTENIFFSLGVSAEQAEIMGNYFEETSLLGIDSHALRLSLNYWSDLRKNKIKVDPTIQILKDNKSTALVDGDNGLGVPIAYKAMKLAIEKAENHGLGMVGVRGESLWRRLILCNACFRKGSHRNSIDQWPGWLHGPLGLYYPSYW